MTCCSCIASSRAACVLGGVRLISSARMMLAKTGPARNLNAALARRLVLLNHFRAGDVRGHQVGRELDAAELSFSERASVLTISVLASPGTPSSRQCPWAKMAISSCSITSSWPTITFASSLRIVRLAALIRLIAEMSSGGKFSGRFSQIWMLCHGGRDRGSGEASRRVNPGGTLSVCHAHVRVGMNSIV